MGPDVRAHMESAFGADFGNVRLHTDANADVLNRTLGADAFTTGRDIYFRQGRYDPDGTSGRRLLAHELTHVVQQAGSTPQGGLVVGAPDDIYEQEAEHVAEAVVHTVTHETPRNTAAASQVQTSAIQRMCAKCQEDEEEPA